MSCIMTLSGNCKKLWNMKVTVITIVIDAIGTVTKGLVKRQEGFEIRGRVETIKTTASLLSARILRGVLETWWDLLSLKLQWKPFTNLSVKYSQMSKIIIIVCLRERAAKISDILP